MDAWWSSTPQHGSIAAMTFRLVHAAVQAESRLELDDLLQECHIALLRALDYHDRRRAPFHAYARACIERELEKARRQLPPRGVVVPFSGYDGAEFLPDHSLAEVVELAHVVLDGHLVFGRAVLGQRLVEMNAHPQRYARARTRMAAAYRDAA